MELALYGSFLPVPERAGLKASTTEDASTVDPPGVVPTFRSATTGDVVPTFRSAGEIFPADGELTLNDGREAVQVTVTNRGDRPIQVGSHYHFAQTNRALEFDRGVAAGRRLDIPAGTAVRFEPGETKTVALVEIAGNRVVRGGLL